MSEASPAACSCSGSSVAPLRVACTCPAFQLYTSCPLPLCCSRHSTPMRSRLGAMEKLQCRVTGDPSRRFRAWVSDVTWNSTVGRIEGGLWTVSSPGHMASEWWADSFSSSLPRTVVPTEFISYPANKWGSARAAWHPWEPELMVLLLRSPVLGLHPPGLLFNSSVTKIRLSSMCTGSLVTMRSALPSLDTLLGSLFGGYDSQL